MFPFRICRLILGLLYLTFTTIGTPFGIIGYALGKITIFYLVTSIGPTPLDILIPLWLLIQQHNESEVQNFELFVQTFHFPSLFYNKEVK
jgi:hypothetical protein